MSTQAQITANTANAQLSTGPRTEAGRASSARNGVTHGLFSRHDFIRPDEEDAYAQTRADLEKSLAPAGPLELGLVNEIHRAFWRLRRCGDVEGSFDTANSDTPAPDPMQNDDTARLQASVDRARGNAHRMLHKCIAQLRHLQTERRFLQATGDTLPDPGLCDYRALQKALDQQVAGRLRKRQLMESEQFDEMCAVTTERAHRLLAKQTQSAPPPAPSIARNAPCPCRSGEKYKRCCGKNAPPVLHTA